MKKRLIAVVFAAIAAVLPLSSCVLWDNCSAWNKEHCWHNWEHEIKEPTCTEAGEEYMICRKCYSRETIRVIAAVPHDYKPYASNYDGDCLSASQSLRCSACNDAILVSYAPSSFTEISHDWDYENAEYSHDEHGCEFVTLTCKNCQDVTKTLHMWDDDAIAWYENKQSETDIRKTERYSEVCPDCGQKIELFYFNYISYSWVMKQPESNTDTAIVGFVTDYSYRVGVSFTYFNLGVTIELSPEEYESYLNGEYVPPRNLHEFIAE